MSEKLEQLNKEIETIESERLSLQSELQKKKKLLVEKQNELDKAIRARMDTSKISAEISEMQVEIDARVRVIKGLLQDLEPLREAQKVELMGVALIQAQQAGDEAIDAVRVVYMALIEFVEKAVVVKTKAKEFQRRLKRSYPTEMHTRSSRINLLVQNAEKEIPIILNQFANFGFISKENLPQPDDLKKKLRSPQAPGLPFDRHGSMEPRERPR